MLIAVAMESTRTHDNPGSPSVMTCMVSVGWLAVVNECTVTDCHNCFRLARCCRGNNCGKTHCVAIPTSQAHNLAGNVHKLPQIVSLCKTKNAIVHLNPTLMPLNLVSSRCFQIKRFGAQLFLFPTYAISAYSGVMFRSVTLPY